MISIQDIAGIIGRQNAGIYEYRAAGGRGGAGKERMNIKTQELRNVAAAGDAE
jgi:hypothetical protein